MTNPPTSPEIVLRTAMPGPRTGCANCAAAQQEDLRTVVENLARKYTELADVLAGYMSQAGLERSARTANAVQLTAELARITGGHPTSAGTYPDCVLVGRRAANGTQRWFCSGALVHPRVVLTAGHCQTPAAGINLVALNALDIGQLDNAEVIGVRRVRVNPNYPQVIGNDITVLVLREESTIPPVPIVTAEELAAVTQTTLVGFGNSDLLSTKGFGTQREVTVDITNLRRSDTDDLDRAEQSLGFESDREFTAGGGGFDSCNGDSGGPAYVAVDGVRKLAGLTSRATEGFTNPCGDGGIYTRVDTQRSFIDEVLSEVGIAL